jgi:hypothetical protein
MGHLQLFQFTEELYHLFTANLPPFVEPEVSVSFSQHNSSGPFSESGNSVQISVSCLISAITLCSDLPLILSNIFGNHRFKPWCLVFSVTLGVRSSAAQVLSCKDYLVVRFRPPLTDRFATWHGLHKKDFLIQHVYLLTKATQLINNYRQRSKLNASPTRASQG